MLKHCFPRGDGSCKKLPEGGLAGGIAWGEVLLRFVSDLLDPVAQAGDGEAADVRRVGR